MGFRLSPGSEDAKKPHTTGRHCLSKPVSGGPLGASVGDRQMKANASFLAVWVCPVRILG